MARQASFSAPDSVREVLETLWRGGHAAYLVGGGVRDGLLGRPVTDWDVATDARPERIVGLFPNGRSDNPFGTVTVPIRADPVVDKVEVTTFRQDHVYTDHRRPHSVTFTNDIGEDLVRRDFTVNAIAWGKPAPSIEQEPATEPTWVDPTNGLIDLEARVLRAVGDPVARFDEDALRLLRAARLTAQLGFEIDPGTQKGMTAAAETIRYVSNERIGMELERMLEANKPSRAFDLLAETGVLEHALPELAAQRGIPQDKADGMDLWAHCLATLDEAARLRPAGNELRLAALLHDIGKPSTFADGHFIGHDQVGAEMAYGLLARLTFGRAVREHVERLIRNHMFSYEPRWSGAAVRRFIRRVGHDLVRDQLDLRAADNVGSGLPASAGHLDELRTRVDSELASGAPLTLRDLAVDGDDLVAEVTQRPGTMIGWLLKHLLDWVIEDPARNKREALIAEARAETARVKAL